MKENEISEMADDISEEIVRAFAEKFNTRLKYIEIFIRKQQEVINRLIARQKAVVSQIENIKSELDIVERTFREEADRESRMEEQGSGEQI